MSHKTRKFGQTELSPDEFTEKVTRYREWVAKFKKALSEVSTKVDLDDMDADELNSRKLFKLLNVLIEGMPKLHSDNIEEWRYLLRLHLLWGKFEMEEFGEVYDEAE
jgi:hypothetical protein